MESAAASQDFAEPAPFTAQADGLALTFLPAGSDRFEALIGMIEGARRTLDLVFYIYAMDISGTAVRDALLRAARRGVKVTLILDGFGAVATDAFFAPLTDAGGIVLRFSARWTRRYLIRNHQKMVIADDTRAMIGGFNIEDGYFAPASQGGWSDLGVVVEGEAVRPLAAWFILLQAWTAHPRAQFLAIRRMVREWRPGRGQAQWLVGGPTKWDNSWRRTLFRDLDRAQRFDLVTAYFAPHHWIVRRLARIARRGTLSLLLPAKTDNNATLGAARINYGTLLRAGATIHEFTVTRLHTKLMVIDDVSYIGSANFDMRSLYLNLELMLRIEDKALAGRLRAYIAQHRAASRQVTPALHRRRSTLWNRIRWSLSWMIVSVVDYTVTRRLNLGL